MMQLTPGTRLRSAVCDTQIIVVRAPDGTDVDVRCGGEPMVALDQPVPPVQQPAAGACGTAIGKRYRHAPLGLEVMCTRAGAGDLSVGADLLDMEDARALPSSD